MTGTFDWLHTSPDAFIQRYAPAAAQRAGAQRATQVTKFVSRDRFDPPNNPLPTPVAQIQSPFNNPGAARPRLNTGEHDGTQNLHQELHRMDPAKLISHDGHREMTVLEVIRHLIDGRWPDQESHRSLTQQEVMATQTSETASHQE
jgi:hypothetical protein